ncbi:MAG: four helix bundle protein [Candidatus Binatia bacterium]
MATIRRFEETVAWQTARDLTQVVYGLSSRGKFARDFGLRDQMRRAAASIMSHIAEGFESQSQPLFIQFLRRAKASAGEVKAQLYVALDASYLDRAEFDRLFELTDKCNRQINRLMSHLQDHPNNNV